MVDAAEFIAVKGFKAKGKRLTTYAVAGIEELEPLRNEESVDTETAENPDADALPDNAEGASGDNDSGQMRLF